MTEQRKTHISLFTGIGGFDKAADWIGWENVAHCEWNSFGQYVLKNHWPYSITYHDIKKTNFTIHRHTIFIVSGGFPCQPYSLAGLRKGTEDERHLWPEMLRTIREVAPPWVVGENVRGLINWNGGLVFDEVQADLEAEGYEVLPFLLPAAGVNAPHERYRIWFIAYSHDARTHYRGRINTNRQEADKRRHEQPQPQYWKDGCNGAVVNTGNLNDGYHNSGTRPGIRLQMERHFMDKAEWRESTDNPKSSSVNVANTCGCQQQGSELDGSFREKRPAENESGQFSRSVCSTWEEFPTEPPLCNGDDGLPTEALRQRIRADSMGVISEKEIDKIISEAVNKWQAETIKAGGNAVVPQEVYQIFKAIEQYDKLFNTS